MDRQDLEITMVQATVLVDVLDARIRKMHVAVEVGQIVFIGPVLDLGLVSIGTAVAVGATSIVLLQELLVFALEFVVQKHTLDARAAFLQTLGLTLVCAEDLHVVLHLSRLLQLGVEVLAGVRGARSVVGVVAAIPAMRFEQVSARVGEDHGNVTATVDGNGPHKALLAQVPKVSTARVECSIIMVSEIARRDHAKQPTRLRVRDSEQRRAYQRS
ncbi:MAG: hypothetical protein ACRD1V_00080, partial [Vicinamibacterales bacterium]